MPFGCFATLRSLSHFLQLIRHSSRQLLCPSRHFVHYFLRSASLHLVRSLTICCKAGHSCRPTKPETKVCTCLSASNPYNTHWVSFRFTTSFIHFSSVQSTRCPLFGSPCVPISAAFTLRLLIAHVVPPFRKASLRFTCIVQPPPYPDGKFTTAASYGGSIVAAPYLGFFYITLKRGCYFIAAPSWVLAGTSVRSSLQCLMAARPPRYSVDKCATQLCFFFAAGAITFCQQTRDRFQNQHWFESKDILKENQKRAAS